MAFTLIAVPILDSLRVALVRMWHRRSPILPDKNHIHHKLLRAGCTNHQALLIVVALAIFYCILNVVLRQWLSATTVIVADAACYALFHAVLNRTISGKGLRPIVFLTDNI